MDDNKGRAFTGVCYVSDAGHLTDLSGWLLQIPCILTHSSLYAPPVVQKESAVAVSQNEQHLFVKQVIDIQQTDE